MTLPSKSPPAPCIGIDLIEPVRLRQRLEHNPNLEATLFHPQEVAYCESQPTPDLHLAARYCAKEAVVKALGIDGWNPLDIEVTGGGPDVEIRLGGGVGEQAHNQGVTVTISMTHVHSLAGAVALARPSSLVEVRRQAAARWTVDEVDALHRAKSSSYGIAWRKRGETLSILPNLFRKFDRLDFLRQTGTRSSDGESIEETLLDLFIYLVKYQVLLEMGSNEHAGVDSGPFLDRCTSLFTALLLEHGVSAPTTTTAFDELSSSVSAMESWVTALPVPADRLAVVQVAARTTAVLLELHGAIRDSG